ncbi:beta-glucosidase [Faecalicatena contorta]|uniref:beta-glucosidase n=1 Tax=Faecalicatena contorta TaxID=39482 RepID=UPI001F33E9FB|nr:glycoside hydrolase family 3 C-terminal domain-containing protein [Faecalicatena contorta]MCF2682300.1 glycoside hydrolase family 3 C-terminal domain-containing protein [Faecalicatena contorta]
MADWRLYRISYTEKAKEILDMLSLEEKVSLMSGSETRAEVRGAIQKKLKVHYNEKPYRAGGIQEKGIPPMCFADGTRGVVCGRGTATCFPVASMRGATFLPELEEEIGRAMAEEVLDAGGNFFGGVCVNLPYHPGWGRAQEVYGEDSFLLGEMGSAMVRGVQSTGVIACVKHFAFNSMENSRFKVSIVCDKRTEREVFLSHFKKCVDAGAGSVMSAYNSYQNEACGQNAYLLNQVLKKEWDFDGYVISDFVWGVKDTAASAQAGMDMEMPITHYYGKKLIQAVKNGEVKKEVIDQAAFRIIRTLLAHQAVIDSKKKDGQTGCDYQKHRELALRCAREGITLLKNEDQILPIDCSIEKKKIVVLGALADQENIGDHGSSQVYAPYVITLLKGIVAYGVDAEVIFYAGERAAHCRRLAKEADVVVIVAGNDYLDEGECVANDQSDISVKNDGGDRIAGLGLGEQDQKIIRAVADIRKDAVVVLVGGSVILADEWKDDVGAILMAYYPGMEGGTALAEVLFGKVNPGGKLPFVVPKREQALPTIDWDAECFRYDYYHGYTLLNKRGIAPLYPFGFGLSYTTFRIEKLRSWRDRENLYVSVSVENTGNREGTEVVQMYVGAKASVVERPEYTLKAFRKIFLQAGEKKEVILTCTISEMAYYHEEKNAFVTEYEIPYEVYVGTSSLRTDLQKSIIEINN